MPYHHPSRRSARLDSLLETNSQLSFRIVAAADFTVFHSPGDAASQAPEETFPGLASRVKLRFFSLGRVRTMVSTSVISPQPSSAETAQVWERVILKERQTHRRKLILNPWW